MNFVDTFVSHWLPGLVWEYSGKPGLRMRISATPGTIPSEGCVPGGGVRAVGKWPAGATVQSLAEAGHLSTAVVIATLR